MLETILEKYTIEVVINRTKISRKNLEKLKEKNFEGFTRPQALGFIRILEREFDENFDDLKAELDAWFKERPTSVAEPIFVREEPLERGGAPTRWIVGGLVVLLLLLGGYLFRKEFVSHSDENRTIENVVAEAPEAAANGKAPAASETDGASVRPPAEKSEAFVPDAGATETEEQASAVPQEENVTAPVAEEEPEAFVPLENVALTPVVKLWFGTIDLKTKKRTAKVTANPYEIESRGKKLVVTGHGRFEISDAFGNLFKFNDAKKHYFLIDDGMVKEITAAEFRRLNGGKGW